MGESQRGVWFLFHNETVKEEPLKHSNMAAFKCYFVSLSHVTTGDTRATFMLWVLTSSAVFVKETLPCALCM